MVETLAEIGSHNLTLMSVFFVWKQRHVYKVLNTYEDEIITGFVNTGEWHQIFERSCHTFPLAYSALFFIYVWVEPLLKRKKFKWQKEDYYWGHLFQMNLLLNDKTKTVSGRFTCQSDHLSLLLSQNKDHTSMKKVKAKKKSLNRQLMFCDISDSTWLILLRTIFKLNWTE